MPSTSKEELGRRRFELQKEQAIEAAIEKIRRAPDAGWASFSGGDYTRLREILAEIWIGVDREKWQQYTFSTLTKEDIRELLELYGTAPGRAIPRATMEAMDAVISHTKNAGKKG
ncbi:hypothetical protein [Methanoregula sp.]|uniref:hypothetical protein n=1 Tax=Methanoregula sp. TaxID=2052170 RepID=UPI000CC3043E|nr:hypothetical protein [Methanoregula sp.]PKG33091.1 MAG: hypothetical protein CW742_04750 [Methanoregula sp.]